jgi:AraC-like DNA-binding protein
MLREIYYPSPELEKIITHYLVVEFNNLISGIPCTLPKGACALAITYSEGTPCFTFEDAKNNYSGNTFICGYLLKVVRLNYFGNIKCIVAFFTPLGTWRLFRIPPAEYVNRFISLEDMVGSKCQVLIEKLKSANNSYEAVNYIDAFLKKLIPAKQELSLICEQSVNYIQDNYGKLKMDDLINRLNQCPRSIDRHFERYLGITPKQYIWLTRLNRAFIMLMSNSNISIHEVVLELGYFDQAHLINDVKKYLGTTPQFLRNPILNALISSYTEDRVKC